MSVNISKEEPQETTTNQRIVTAKVYVERDQRPIKFNETIITVKVSKKDITTTESSKYHDDRKNELKRPLNQ